jgi:hypothetical protein
MNNFMNKISQYLGEKSISQYPELYHKNTHSKSLAYEIAIAYSVGVYDAPDNSNSINWKLV